jgi:transglutaminase-like putative cysteine protease
MNTIPRLADCDHPAVREKAYELIHGKLTPLDKLESLFYFVRDGIRFGFPLKWDEVKASETLSYGLGYCNTKISLFLALCQNSGIPARAHFGLLDICCMQGIFPSYSFRFLPKTGGHAWIDVQLEGQWKPMDSYITDKAFYDGAVKRLKASGFPFGYGVAPDTGKSSCEFNFGEKGFIFMGAIVEDHGAWEDAAEYYSSKKYMRLNAMQKMVYPMLAASTNRNIERIRSGMA